MSSLVRRLQKRGKTGNTRTDAPKPNSLPARGSRKGTNKRPQRMPVAAG